MYRGDPLFDEGETRQQGREMKPALFPAALCLGGMACSAPASVADENEESAAISAPPASDGEALLTKYTWRGTGGNEAAKGEWVPRDECGEIDGAYAFRIALADAVIKRDTDAVVAMADPNIKLSFGDDAGRDGLRETLGAPDGEMWRELEQVLALGCAAQGEAGFAVPWYWAQDLGEIDPYSGLIAMGEDTPVFRDATGSDVIGTLEWEMVELDHSLDSGGDMIPVILGDGGTGYVAAGNLRSVIDYRMLVNRGEDGRFYVSAMLAGD